MENLNEKKQIIEEIAEVLKDYTKKNKIMASHVILECYAEELYNVGYRKQSDVIEEYRKKVYSKMEKYTVFGREYIQRIMRESEKEMKGGE